MHEYNYAERKDGRERDGELGGERESWWWGGGKRENDSERESACVCVL